MIESSLAAITAELACTGEPLADARTLPGVVYHAEEILALETRGIFSTCWLAIAREEDVPNAGSFVTQEIGGERILIVRGEDERLRAFFNVCRHRGSRLIEEPSGRLRGGIACPYHAWTYALDGSFRRAPRSSLAEGTATLALAALRLTTWAGFVLVNLDRGARTLDPGALPDLTRFQPERLKRVRRLDYQIDANWKIVCENYSECYHCPLVHPQLHRVGDITSGGFEERAGYNGGPMRLRDGFTTLSMSGQRRGPSLAVSADDDARSVYYFLLYPNLMLGVHPDYLLVHSVWPMTPERSRVTCELYFAPEAFADPTFDAADAIEFWDLTNRQDWGLCERVQKGTASQAYAPGPYHPSERCVHAFDRWYATWLMSALK
jgi:Rieske 2Fe-2S family protein